MLRFFGEKKNNGKNDEIERIKAQIASLESKIQAAEGDPNPQDPGVVETRQKSLDRLRESLALLENPQ